VVASAPQSGQLSLAAAFQLLTRSMAELPLPVAGEAVRARMAALLGREDPLLDPSRFARFLKQANDAEIADVRKLGDDSFEVSPHKTDLSFARAVASRSESLAPDGNGSSPAAVSASEPAARGPVALRFRRGSRAPVRPLELPLIGVVRVDDDVPPEAPVVAAAKPARAPRARAAKAATPPDHDKEPGVAPKKRARPRAKKTG